MVPLLLQKVSCVGPLCPSEERTAYEVSVMQLLDDEETELI